MIHYCYVSNISRAILMTGCEKLKINIFLSRIYNISLIWLANSCYCFKRTVGIHIKILPICYINIRISFDCYKRIYFILTYFRIITIITTKLENICSIIKWDWITTIKNSLPLDTWFRPIYLSIFTNRFAHIRFKYRIISFMSLINLFFN